MLKCLIAAKKTRVSTGRNQSQIGLVEQISSIKELFEAELPYLQFDYLSLHVWCRALFIDLHQELRQDMEKSFRRTFPRQDAIVSSIMIGGSTMRKMLKARYQDRIVPNHFDPIEDGAKVLKKFILKYDLSKPAEASN